MPYTVPAPSPVRPIYLLADSQLLFWSERGRAFAGAIRRQAGAGRPRAAYVGAPNGDDPAYYAIFEAAMQAAGGADCHQVSSEFREQDEERLREADVVLLAGGDVARGWDVLEGTGMARVLRERHDAGAVLVGVSAGAALLGTKGWTADDAERAELFDTLGLVPFVVDAHDEAREWRRLRQAVARSGGASPGLGLPAGGGVIYSPDLSLEPVRRPIVELRLRDEALVDTLLLPPDDPAWLHDPAE